MNTILVPWEVLNDVVDLIPVVYVRTTDIEVLCTCGHKGVLQIRINGKNPEAMNPTISHSIPCGKCYRQFLVSFDKGKLVGVCVKEA